MSEKPIIPGVSAGEDSPADVTLPHTRVSDALDAFVRRIGQAASWVWVLLVLVIVYNVVQRYVFGIGAIWLEELQWHVYAIGFIIGLSYAITADRHVRVDVLSERWSPRTKAWVEMTGLLVLLLPFTVSIVIAAWPFLASSFVLNETSSAPGGLPYRWILKSFILWGFCLLVIAATARLLRCTAMLFGWPKPIWPRD